MNDEEIYVRLIDVGKEFSGVRVLRNINLDFRKGEIHALVGENGAGKSTVGKIAGGYYSRSSGDLEIFGEAVSHWDPAAALKSGIAMMHQELQLVPELTVAQNVFLGIENNRGSFLTNDEPARLAAVIEVCGFQLDPNARAGSLSLADQQKIEIMRAIARDAKVIVMDEPTSSLTADEADRLHATMRRLRAMGRTIIYVSHFLDHVLSIADRVTIMREGAVVRTGSIAEETKASLVAGMLGDAGADVSYLDKTPPVRGAPPLLSVRGLVSDNGVKGADLEIHPGEIVGLIGLVGSGRTEIARAIFGADKTTAGAVMFDGKDYDDRSPRESVARGLAMVPEDRRKQGLVLSQTVRPNMTLPHLGIFSAGGFMKTGAERNAVRSLIDYFGVSPRHVDGDVVHYSGGNQQKVLLAKWIMEEPKLVILDEPSRGVDLGARRRIHEFIVELARKGAGVLLISSEIEEVLGLAHRAYLVREGRTFREIVPEEQGMDQILWALFHDEQSKTARSHS
ncbi:sugar ABC transporter ATP-binding protein [Rhizobium alvei]|uniref:Sugar ABC transporter ATP-binding protein n=1 Tax=Rhizobium alvei TaxID=1132659 RepID=A0ABT8YS80_9HYPH|nr:sugar ABC transporter ATP-binding protein [Rhizobium alvei]MDO6966411.1 sugar ABC transporter ATP-binding protein [Rhizobium alvei]